MKDYFKENFFQFLYLIPVCFIAIGAFILNIYLNQYGIIDIALFDSKTVFVAVVNAENRFPEQGEDIFLNLKL